MGGADAGPVRGSPEGSHAAKFHMQVKQQPINFTSHFLVCCGWTDYKNPAMGLLKAVAGACAYNGRRSTEFGHSLRSNSPHTLRSSVFVPARPHPLPSQRFSPRLRRRPLTTRRMRSGACTCLPLHVSVIALRLEVLLAHQPQPSPSKRSPLVPLPGFAAHISVPAQTARAAP